jgi:hypothetical protein
LLALPIQIDGGGLQEVFVCPVHVADLGGDE